MPVIKPNFTFFQMKIKAVFLQTPKFNQACFSMCPETFDPINIVIDLHNRDKGRCLKNQTAPVLRKTSFQTENRPAFLRAGCIRKSLPYAAIRIPPHIFVKMTEKPPAWPVFFPHDFQRLP